MRKWIAAGLLLVALGSFGSARRRPTPLSQRPKAAPAEAPAAQPAEPPRRESSTLSLPWLQIEPSWAEAETPTPETTTTTPPAAASAQTSTSSTGLDQIAARRAARRAERDRRIVQAYVRMRLPEITACYKDALKWSPRLHGQIRIEMTVAPNGESDNALIESAQVDTDGGRSPIFELCVLNKLAAAELPAPSQRLYLSLPFTLVLDNDAGRADEPDEDEQHDSDDSGDTEDADEMQVEVRNE